MSPARKCLVSAGMAALVLVGCTPVDRDAEAPAAALPPPPPTSQAAPPSDSAKPDPGANACGSDRLTAYADQPASDDTLAKIRAAAGHDRIRVIRPGDAVTQDYREDRLNIEIGDEGRIKAMRCG